MMEIGSQKMQNAASSCCRSFGSSQNPSGQFPKVSIGITVDKCPKTGPGPRNEDTSALPAGGRTVLCQGGEITTKPGIVEGLERNRLDDVEDNKASSWFSTRSVRVETPTAETVKFFVNRASVLQSEDGVHKKFDTVAYGKRREKGGNVDRVEEVAFVAMQETRLVDKGNPREEPEKTAKVNEKRLNPVTYGRRRENNGDVERMEEVAISTKQLVGEENGKEPEEMAKCNKEALKMKLWEILGTAPSQNKHTMNSPNVMDNKGSLNINQSRENQKGKLARTKLNSPDLEENKENLNINQSREYKKGKAATKPKLRELEQNKQDLIIKQSRPLQKRKAPKAKQNSDAIETDSESPDQVMRRPVTRSLSRKKAPLKRVEKFQGNVGYGKKPLSSSSSDFKLKLEKNNIFAFDEVEGKAGRLGRTSSGQSHRSKEKINEQNKVKIEPRRIYFPRSISEKSSHDSDKEQTSFSPDKASSQSKEKWNSVPHQDKNHFSQAVGGTLNNSDHSDRAVQPNFGSPLWAYKRDTRENTDSPLVEMKKHSWGRENSPPESKSALLHDDVAGQSMGRDVNHLDDFCSPTLAMNNSPSSPSMPHNEDLSTPLAALPSKSNQKDYNSRDWDNYTPGSCQPDADTESSDDTREMNKPGDMESPYMKDEEPEKQQLSLSPMEEQDTESEADDLLSQGFGLTDKWFPSLGIPFSLHQTKRVRSLNNVKLSRPNLSSPSPIGTSRTEETVISFEALEQYPEGSLARCFSQLILVLQRFKARIKSQTSKRSSEILSTAADKIRQQLQDVESQILGDVGKFNKIGQSKRRRLESRFQEQQERLKLIHDKFKEEVNQYLLDCRSILEDFDAYNMELKGTADREKASHRKLLLQVKEAMEAQINGAEASIAAVQKDARKKMIGLKRVLKEWMD